jgi:hypothetical protein
VKVKTRLNISITVLLMFSPHKNQYQHPSLFTMGVSSCQKSNRSQNDIGVFGLFFFSVASFIFIDLVIQILTHTP